MTSFTVGPSLISESIPCSFQALEGKKKPAPVEPIPVTDRLPTLEDCNKQGFLWVYDPIMFTISLGWLEADPVIKGRFKIREVSHSSGRPVTHWFPAHFLQLSTPDDGIIP